MKNQIETAEFEITGGKKVVVTAELILSKVHYADGDNIRVDCCEMGLVRAKLDGHPDQTGYSAFTAPVAHASGKLYGAIGKLGLTAKNKAVVDGIVNKLKKHPTWIARAARIEKNLKEIAEMEARRDANGYCRKCGSYCHGDCGL